MITVEEKIRSMTHKELYDFLNSIAQNGPWYDEFDEHCCKNCETIEVGRNTYAYCEIVGNECPHGDVLEWWLKRPAENKNTCDGYCDFYYDENLNEHVCRNCGYVLTKKEKRKSLEYANALRRQEEDNNGNT